MLIQKSSRIDAGDTATFKLSNGDEIIANVESVEDDAYILNNPCLVVPSKQGVGLMQAMFTINIDARVQLNRASIMMQGITMDEMKSHYVQTTSGIIT
jgi:hypothetical protein